jgi:K+ transporter
MYILDGLVRVLALFEILVDGSPASIPEPMLHDQNFTGVEVVGIVATLKAPEGLFAQCGWFGGDDLDWFWARITGWESLHLRADSRFRDG